MTASDGGDGRRSRSSRSRWRRSTARLMEELRTARPRRDDPSPKPNEVADAIPFDEDETHHVLRPRLRESLLAGARAVRPRVQAVPRPLHRQVQPGALLLGRARPRRHALLRPARPAASRAASPTCPTAWPARPTRTRSAAWASGRAAAPIDYPAFYSYAYPEPPGFRTRRRPPAGAFYSKDLQRVHPALRRRAHRARRPTTALLSFARTTYEAAADLGEVGSERAGESGLPRRRPRRGPPAATRSGSGRGRTGPRRRGAARARARPRR